MIERALELATRARWLTPPNPSVGCVIASATGQRLGEGHTQRVGGPHAEIMALHDAAQRGQSVHGATAYVTLEPCAHQGRTGPCCDALIASGIKKVVASIADPNPLVAGKGFARLLAAGVEVEVGPGAAASRALNIGFFSRMLRKRPWLRMKVAASLDGITALDNGVSQWITSPEARADGHAWRARACAVLTGIGTIKADNPLLDVRLVDSPRQPHLVVVDSRLETPIGARLFDVKRTVVIYAAVPNAERKAALESCGAKVVYCPGSVSGMESKVDLAAMLGDLAHREMNELHVEAGEKLNGSLLRHRLVDEIVAYLAPKLIGTGRGMANLPSLTSLDGAFPLTFESVEQVGVDVRLTARYSGEDAF